MGDHQNDTGLFGPGGVPLNQGEGMQQAQMPQGDEDIIPENAQYQGQNPNPQEPNPNVPLPPGLTLDQITHLFQLFQGMNTARALKPVDVPTKTIEEFDGDSKNAMKFVEDCKLQFIVNKHKFATDEAKIGYVLSYCRVGAARDFAQLTFQQYEVEGWETWTEFSVRFTRQFFTTDIKGEALMELKKLKMTGTADEYVSRFRLLTFKAEIKDDRMLQSEFIKGLHPAIVTWLEITGIPSTITELYKAVQDKDSRYHYLKQLRASSNYEGNWRSQNQQQQNQSWRQSKPQNNTPMEVDVMSVMERDKCIRNGLCFVCQKHGHLSRDYPDKKTRAPKNDKNPFRQKKVATAEKKQEETPKQTMSAEEKAAAIAELLKGSDDDNAQIRAILLEKGFQ